MTPLTDPERESLHSIIHDLQKERDQYLKDLFKGSQKYEDLKWEIARQKREIYRLRAEIARLELYNDTMKVAQ